MCNTSKSTNLLTLLAIVILALGLGNAAIAIVDYEYLPLNAPTTSTTTPITTSTACASSTYTGYACPPLNVFDNHGMSGTKNPQDTHDTTKTDMWMTNGTTTGWVQVNLGGIYPIGKMLVWNYNAWISGVSHSKRGMQNVTVYYCADGANWYTLGSYTLPEAASSNTPTPAGSIIDFGGVAARYVQITANSNWGDTQYVGLGQVRLYHYGSAVAASGDFIASKALNWSSAYAPSTNPVNTINNYQMSDDGSGAYTSSATITNSAVLTSWLSAANDPAPYITYDLGGTYPLSSMYVWNYNLVSGGNSYTGRGLQNASIYYSINGNWIKLVGTNSDGSWTFAEAGGVNGQGYTSSFSFNNAPARYVKIVPNVGMNNGNWGGGYGDGSTVYYGLSQVRFFAGSGTVSEPMPYWDGLLGQRALSGQVWSGSDYSFSIPYLGPSGATCSLFSYGDSYYDHWDPLTYARSSTALYKHQSWQYYNGGVNYTPALSTDSFDFTQIQPNQTTYPNQWDSPLGGIYVAQSGNTGNIYELAARSKVVGGVETQMGSDIIDIPVTSGVPSLSGATSNDTGMYNTTSGYPMGFGVEVVNNAAVDGYYYVYGFLGAYSYYFGALYAPIVGRTADFSNYTFYDSTGNWVPGYTNAAPIGGYNYQFYSITPAWDSAHSGQWMLTLINCGVADLEVSYSPNLTGPFTTWTDLYAPPENDPDWMPNYTMHYFAVHHPELSLPGEAVFSYAVGAAENNPTYLNLNSDLYHRRFIRVRTIQ